MDGTLVAVISIAFCVISNVSLPDSDALSELGLESNPLQKYCKKSAPLPHMLTNVTYCSKTSNII